MPDSQLKAKIAKADEDGKVVIYRHCSDGREPTMPESNLSADQLEHSPDYAGRPVQGIILAH